MDSNYACGIVVGRGMSRASKRAKERQNQSSDELVMDKTKISRSQNIQVTDVRGVGRPEKSEICNFGSG